MTSIVPELSVIVPIYNEQDNIPLLVSNITDALRNVTHEIILVDDGSTDNTVSLANSHDWEHTILIELKKNYGQSLAIAAGINHAKGSFVATMDGDLQNNPNDLVKMLELMKTQSWDVVTGIRQKRKDHWLKTFPSKIANLIIRKTTGLHIKDHGCALKIFNQETAKSLNLYGEMHRYINLLAYFNGAKIHQIPVQHHARKFGVSKYGLGRTTKVIFDLILLLFQQKYMQRPIHFFGNIGSVLSGLGVLICCWLLIVKFVFGEEIGNRPLLILGVLMIVVGIQFFTSGIILDLLMRTYFESQNKTPYQIRKIHN